jgi:hypothetical protein
MGDPERANDRDAGTVASRSRHGLQGGLSPDPHAFVEPAADAARQQLVFTRKARFCKTRLVPSRAGVDTSRAAGAKTLHQGQRHASPALFPPATQARAVARRLSPQAGAAPIMPP